MKRIGLVYPGEKGLEGGSNCLQLLEGNHKEDGAQILSGATQYNKGQ